MQKKLTKKDKIILISLIAAMVVVIIVGTVVIVSNVAGANREAEKLKEKASGAEITTSESATEKTTDDTTSSSGSTKSDAKSSKTDSDKKSSDTSSSSETSSKSSSAVSSKTSSKTSSATSSKTSSKTSSTASVKGDKVSEIKPEHTSSHVTEKILKVNGKKCHVGDTITVVLNLQSDKSVVNYQGYTNIDTKYLKIKEVTPNGLGITNGDGGTITYNASVVNGMNFSQTGSIYSVTLEVLSEGSTEIKNNLEIISELGSDYLPHQLADSDYTAELVIYN